MAKAPPVVLSIAGYDPSSGAGITADIKTIAAHHCFGITCATAMTVQSTRGVKRVQPLAGAMVSATLAELASDFDPAAIRIGMLGSGEVAEAVANFLAKAGATKVVLDPILRSSSGVELLDHQGLEVLRSRLLPLATVVTPNLDEAAALTGLAISDAGGMKAAAERLHELGAANVVITGGHLPQPMDLLSCRSGNGIMQQEFRGERIQSRATHGTGCAFATALACNLALGSALPEAVGRAGEYVRAAIRHAYPVGKGRGPVNHLYEFER